MSPGNGAETLDELCRGIKHGVLVYDVMVASDQQFASVFAPLIAFEIKNGQIVCNIKGRAMQATTKRLWNKSLKTVATANTVEHVRAFSTKSQPVQWCIGTASAPAGLLTDVDIVNSGGGVG
jgi:predicted Zn-dependent protease